MPSQRIGTRVSEIPPRSMLHACSEQRLNVGSALHPGHDNARQKALPILALAAQESRLEAALLVRGRPNDIVTVRRFSARD